MLPEKIITWFLPVWAKDKSHPRHHELYATTGPIIVGVLAVLLIPLVLNHYNVGTHLEMYVLNAALNTVTLFSIKYTGHYRTTNIISMLVTYFIVYTWLENTGLIFSVNICIVHMFLLGGVLVDRKFGWIVIFLNVFFLVFIYNETLKSARLAALQTSLGSEFHALVMHCIITVFLGGFLFYTLNNIESNRKKIIALRDRKIDVLDEEVRIRTEQLKSMRQTIAADFHDHTGNMLAAINRQASTLGLKLHDQPQMMPLIESIITNSNDLYASSKDFLWNLNNESDNPVTLFNYLTGHGQNFYNQFDIAFSAEVTGIQYEHRLDPFAALNIIYIFKEAMNNVVKHSGADEVYMSLEYGPETIAYRLKDNGNWKPADPRVPHYGLRNMKRRSAQAGFEYELEHCEDGTQVAITLKPGSGNTSK